MGQLTIKSWANLKLIIQILNGKMVRRYYRRRSFRRNSSRRFRRYISKPTRTFKRKVQKVIYRTSETKYAVENLAGIFNNNINIWTIPGIVVGGGRANRIGNKIWARWVSFDFTFRHDAAPNVNNDTRFAHRLRLVWPKNLSTNDAGNKININNFPVFGARNEEDFILIKEWVFTTHNSERANAQDYTGSVTMKRIKINWGANRALHYADGVSDTPEKTVFLVHSVAVLQGVRTEGALHIDGYRRVSYKDI